MVNTKQFEEIFNPQYRRYYKELTPRMRFFLRFEHTMPAVYEMAREDVHWKVIPVNGSPPFLLYALQPGFNDYPWFKKLLLLGKERIRGIPVLISRNDPLNSRTVIRAWLW